MSHVLGDTLVDHLPIYETLRKGAQKCRQVSTLGDLSETKQSLKQKGVVSFGSDDESINAGKKGKGEEEYHTRIPLAMSAVNLPPPVSN